MRERSQTDRAALDFGLGGLRPGAIWKCKGENHEIASCGRFVECCALSTAATAAPIMNQSGLGQAPDAIVHVKKKKMKKNMKGMDHSKMKM